MNKKQLPGTMTISKNSLYKIIGLIAVLIIIPIYFIFQPAKSQISGTSQLSGDSQTVELTSVSSGYTPSVITAKAGVPLKLKATSDGSAGCQNSLTIPELNINKTLSKGVVSEITIPAHTTGKKLLITCSMGMYNATINFL